MCTSFYFWFTLLFSSFHLRWYCVAFCLIIYKKRDYLVMWRVAKWIETHNLSIFHFVSVFVLSCVRFYIKLWSCSLLLQQRTFAFLLFKTKKTTFNNKISAKYFIRHRKRMKCFHIILYIVLIPKRAIAKTRPHRAKPI